MTSLSARLSVLIVIVATGCSTYTPPKHKPFRFPKDAAFVDDVKRPYKSLGLVKTKVNFPTLDPNSDETDLCRNYYNKAVDDLLKIAREQGADAIINIKSVVYTEDGRFEYYKTPECADDGSEGQILAQAIAIKWL